MKETKSPSLNQKSVVYSFQCDLCDVDYVDYTREYANNRAKGHKQQSSAKNVLGMIPQGLLKRFEELKKHRSKFDCLVYEMLFVRALKPNLDVQSDSIRAKVFSRSSHLSMLILCAKNALKSFLPFYL